MDIIEKNSQLGELQMQPVSLLVFRLEIEDGSYVPAYFNYKADNYYASKQHMSGKVMAENLEKRRGDTTLAPDIVEDRKMHCGVREARNITIETHTNDESKSSFHEDDEEELSATPKILSKEESAVYQIGGISKRTRTSPVPFFSGNPMVEHTAGILHLYKDDQLTPVDEEVSRSEMICIMAVPAKLTCIDLQQFTQPVKESIKHIQIIRDNSPNQYMVLIKFKDQASADGFYKDFNGRPYNMLEAEVARLVYIAKLETVTASEGGYLPVSGLTELPTCPVCLERMDESVEGILTILCNHSFHGDCLVQWSDVTCPVCRFNQTPKPVAEQRCFQCDSTESLWICLICGHIGCGRYKDQHAYQHYKQTSHTFSMQLENQRVWDYTGDNYVHRLVQNKSDGKIVAVDGEREAMDDEKLDSLNLEYTYLLTSQLESQRLYFEDKMTFLEKDAMERILSIEERMKKVMDDNQHLEEKVKHIEKERKNFEKKYVQVVNRVGNLVHELKEEKEMNKCLLDNQKLWQQRYDEMDERSKKLEATKDTEIADLNGQLEDLMRHLSIQSAVANSSEDTKKELQDGSLVLQENQKHSHRTRASPKGKGRSARDR